MTKPEAYGLIWRKLSNHYENPSANVTAALEILSELKPVKEKDYDGLIILVDEVESCFCQLSSIVRGFQPPCLGGGVEGARSPASCPGMFWEGVRGS